MVKYLENNYGLDNINDPIDDESLTKALTDFEYLCEHYMQIVDKNGKLVPFKLNNAQKYLFKTLWPMINPNTRIDRHRDVVICKCRQLGISVFIIAFMDFVCAYASGIENLNAIHLFPVTDTVTRFTDSKVEPIITGIHPAIQPAIERRKLGSSIIYDYDNILGVPRNNHYEFVSAGTKSIRSSTINVSLFDEYGFYNDPASVEAVVSGAMPESGFSLSVFFSTFGEKTGARFLEKLKTARDNPELMDLVFIPWFISYPEVPYGVRLDELELNKYEEEVIVPAMMEYDIPREEWGDKITWYRRKRVTMPESHIWQEFPTTIDEIIDSADNENVFSQKAIEYQRSKEEPGELHSIMTDNITKKVKAVKDDSGDFKIFRQPVYGRKYIVVVDPITSQSLDSDFFAMSVFDTESLEQVATFRQKELSVEDYADICVSAAKIYNKAPICPERNVAEGLVACIRALGYYNFFYETSQARARKEVGIRTTASAKTSMLEKLSMLLEQKKLTLHDKAWIDELEWFEKKVKKRQDGTFSVKMAARKGKTDDCVSVCWVFAGTLSQNQLQGRKKVGFSVAW